MGKREEGIVHMHRQAYSVDKRLEMGNRTSLHYDTLIMGNRLAKDTVARG